MEYLTFFREVSFKDTQFKPEVKIQNLSFAPFITQTAKDGFKSFLTALNKSGYAKEANSRNQYEETPFIIAVKHRSSPQTLEVLLKAGADINAQDKFGNTAFIYIVKHPQAMMRLRGLDFMIDNGANPNTKNKHGKTVWDYAAKQDGLTDYLCVRLLEEKSDE